MPDNVIDLTTDEGKAALAEMVKKAAGDMAAEIVAAKVSEETDGLKRKRDELLAELRTAKGKIKALPEGFDPEKYATLLAAEAEREENEAKAAGDWDKLKGQLVDTHTAAIGEKDTLIASLKGALDRELIDNKLLAEIAKAEGNTDLLMPHVRRQVKLFEADGKYTVKVIDSEGTPRIHGAQGAEMPVASLLEEMKENDIFAPAFKGSRASGSGANGSGSGGGAGKTNPWKADSLNLSAQGTILKENPDLAKRLQAEAGH